MKRRVVIKILTLHFLDYEGISLGTELATCVAIFPNGYSTACHHCALFLAHYELVTS